jgi:NADH-quinone oxidoreductase subunit L
VVALVPLFPLVGFLINAAFGRRLSKPISGTVASGAMLAAFAAGLAAFWSLLGRGAPVEITLFTWMTSQDFEVPLRFRFDPLGGLMTLVVTGIGFLIHVYSTAYMHDETDAEYARYFSYLNLFAFFMLLLVLAANFIVMFVGWEGVGLCSYLLIGFWFRKKSASDAGKKAFVVNRIGDVGFVLGILMLFAAFGTLDFVGVAEAVSERPIETAFGPLSLATFLLFIGATGKSAQIPLYVWLPDAMEGPTPVSALIHAATMVTAGVYMIGRNATLFSHAPETLAIVAIVGALTALVAGTIGLVQNDIKRVLAYSTVSQLGYMFLAMGVGAFAAGIFHLFTHAFFKALLFLGSGAVIHALAGEQDLRRMGGLRRHLPVTYWTFLVGAVAIAGVPPLAGFFSKDEILFRTFASGQRLLWIVGVATSLLTATYMFRLVFLAFHGEPAHLPAVPGEPAHPDQAHERHGAHQSHRPHDAPLAMALPLVLLAIGSAVAGFVGVPHALGGENRIERFLAPSFFPAAGAHEHVEGEAAEHAADTGTELALMGLSTTVAFAGIGIAAMFYVRRREWAAAVAARFPGVHRILLNKYYVDELYDVAIVRPIHAISRDGLWRIVDAGLIDGAVNGAGLIVRGWAALLRRAQTGSVRTYAVSVLAGVLFILAFYLSR